MRFCTYLIFGHIIQSDYNLTFINPIKCYTANPYYTSELRYSIVYCYIIQLMIVIFS